MRPLRQGLTEKSHRKLISHFSYVHYKCESVKNALKSGVKPIRLVGPVLGRKGKPVFHKDPALTPSPRASCTALPNTGFANSVHNDRVEIGPDLCHTTQRMQDS